MCNLCDIEIGEYSELEPTEQTQKYFCGESILLCRESQGYELVYDDCMSYKCNFCPKCGRDLR